MSKKEFFIVVCVGSVLGWAITASPQNYYLSPLYWWLTH